MTAINQLKDIIDRVSNEYYLKGESYSSLFDALEKQINQLLDPDFPSKDRQLHTIQSLKYNKLIYEEKDASRLLFTLFETITDKPLTQPDDFDLLPNFFNEHTVYAIYNILAIGTRVDELKLKSYTILLELRGWVLTAQRRHDFLLLYRKIAVLLIREAMEHLEQGGSQEKYLPQIAKFIEGLEEGMNTPQVFSTEIAKSLTFEILLCKVKVAIYIQNLPQAQQLIQDHIKIYIESLQDLASEKQKIAFSEEPFLKQTNIRYRQLLLLQIKIFALQENFIEATKILNSEAWDEYCKGIIFHQLGNLLFRTRKFHTAFLHYEKALQSMITQRFSNLFRAKQIAKVLTTMGLVVMKESNFLDGFHFLGLASLLHPTLLSKELVLLRLGECCIQHERIFEQEKQQTPALHRFPISIQALPYSTKQRLLLRFGNYEKLSSSSTLQASAKEYENLVSLIVPIQESERNSIVSALMSCSLSSAAILLQMAHNLLVQKDEAIKATSKHLTIAKAVLMNLAYVYLRLKDYRLAVYYGNQHILCGGRKSAVVANIVAQGLFYLNRFEECDKVIRAAIQEQSIIIEADATTPYSQHFIADQYVLSAQYLQCKAPNELEKIGLMSNALTMSFIIKENLDLTVVEQLLKQYPRLTPVWKCLIFSHLKRRNAEDIKILVKTYVQKTK